MVPVVVAPLRLKGRVHQFEARLARAHTRKQLKITMPGPMTIVDTVAGVAGAQEAARGRPIRFLAGVEISAATDRHNCDRSIFEGFEVTGLPAGPAILAEAMKLRGWV